MTFGYMCSVSFQDAVKMTTVAKTGLGSDSVSIPEGGASQKIQMQVKISPHHLGRACNKIEGSFAGHI
jgi:hypothetical protein